MAGSQTRTIHEGIGIGGHGGGAHNSRAPSWRRAWRLKRSRGEAAVAQHGQCARDDVACLRGNTRGGSRDVTHYRIP